MLWEAVIGLVVVGLVWVGVGMNVARAGKMAMMEMRDQLLQWVSSFYAFVGY